MHIRTSSHSTAVAMESGFTAHPAVFIERLKPAKGEMRQASPSARRRSYLVSCDVKQDIRVLSGITYHLAKQGVEDGLLTGMMNLYPRGISDWRVYARAGLWKLSGGLRGRHGFKYTDGYLDGIWKHRLPALRDSIVINNLQLFGSHFLQSHRALGIEPYFYIDGTLDEYFDNYRAFDTANIDETAMRQALAVEREGYASCRKIAVMSKRTAANVVQYYDVPVGKIHIVPPGANIPERLLETLDSRPERRRQADRRTLIIGFIGLFPERKGLPTIAEAIRLLRGAGYDTRLHVIGKCPPEISEWDGIIHFGLIDKRVDMDRFIEIVRNVDVGCMLSRAELTGIALLIPANGRTDHRHGCRWHSRHCPPWRRTLGSTGNLAGRSGGALRSYD